VGKTKEKRTEQRLRYRWPVRFAAKVGQRPLRGQIVDVTSGGLAFLCHPGEDCPHPDQFVTAGFGVPHFNSHGSFDTVFFNRVGRVCRVDSLNDKVSRVAIQFAEPLFFQPGQQDISDSAAQQRLEAKARSLVKAERAIATGDEAPDMTASRAAAKRKSPAQAKRQVTSEKKGRRKVQVHAEQPANVSTGAAEVIAGIEVGVDVDAPASVAKRSAASKKKNAKRSASPPSDRGLLKKVDSFITDKSKVF
jgi:hypothetical protein